MQVPQFVFSFAKVQTSTTTSYENWIALNRLEIIFCIQIRMKHLLHEQQVNGPLCVPLFSIALDQFLR